MWPHWLDDLWVSMAASSLGEGPVRAAGPTRLIKTASYLGLIITEFASSNNKKGAWRGAGGAHPAAVSAAPSRRWGELAPTMWHLAPEAPPELFLDPALLEEQAGSHHVAWPVGLRFEPLFSRAGPHNFPPIPSSERPQEAAPLQPPLFFV
jgi:hypothetical protein